MTFHKRFQIHNKVQYTLAEHGKYCIFHSSQVCGKHFWPAYFNGLLWLTRYEYLKILLSVFSSRPYLYNEGLRLKFRLSISEKLNFAQMAHELWNTVYICNYVCYRHLHAISQRDWPINIVFHLKFGAIFLCQTILQPQC